MTNQGHNSEQATIWEVPEWLWSIFSAMFHTAGLLIPRAGRRRCFFGLILNTIIYRIRSGLQWKQLPKEIADDSTRQHLPSLVSAFVKGRDLDIPGQGTLSV